MNTDKLIVICGTAGSGKSTALNVLEDMGFHCVDNLPAPLIEHFFDFIKQSSLSSSDNRSKCENNSQFPCKQYALLVYSHSADSLKELNQTLDSFRNSEINIELWYFDCGDEEIVRRFRETRRPHPLLRHAERNYTLLEALKEEREAMSDFREKSDRVFDTTGMSPHELRRNLEHELSSEKQIRVELVSFGYKHGLPVNLDLLFDVRFIDNPYFVKGLREKTGLQKEVSEYVMSADGVGEFVGQTEKLLDFLIPRYEHEGKRYLIIGFGCTGGKHRSVAIAECFGRILLNKNLSVSVRHRDRPQIEQ